MTAAESIRISFKELLGKRPFDKITVSNICEKAHVSRKTFYVNYMDKRAVLEQLFFIDVLEPLSDLQKLLPVGDLKSSPMLLCERMYQSIYDNRAYYENFIRLNGHHLFIEVVTTQISRMNMKVLNSYKLNQTEQEYMAYFFGAAQAMLLSKWITDKMTVSPHQMAVFFTKWSIHSWEQVYPKSRNW
jgi:AcrR family transcriptional regulator